MSAVTARLRAIPSWQVTLGVALLALGFLIAAQLASEGPRIRYTSQERAPLLETALGLQQEQDELKARILELRTRIGDLEEQGQGSAVLAQELNDRLTEARIAAGLVPLTGPGIVLRLEDSAVEPTPGDPDAARYLVQAADVLIVVDELWIAGAEAVSINGERVAALTAVVDIGGSVLVNSAYLAPPYEVTAIGPTDLVDRLTTSPGFADLVAARIEAYGIRISVATPGTVDVPAYAGSVNLRYSRPLADEDAG